MINFQLKNIEDILPAGTEENLSTSWFWLTDAYLWLNLGERVIYEYTQEALDHIGVKEPYNDYPLSRFIEDFTELFELVSESIPLEIYQLTEDMDQFLADAQKWLDLYDTDEENFSDFYFEEYDTLISWTYNRGLNSLHLIGGPYISFFRHKDKLRIIWNTEYQLDNGIDLWTAKDGSLEMSYDDFIIQVKNFQSNFDSQMNQQVELALAKDWGKIQLDKNYLIKEHRDRKEQFQKQLDKLINGSTNTTNWKEIAELLHRMRRELKQQT